MYATDDDFTTPRLTRKDSIIGDPTKSTFLLFAPQTEEVGSLVKYLHIFKTHEISLRHIESRPSNRIPDVCEFLVECAPSPNLRKAIEDVKKNSQFLTVLSKDYKQNKDAVPWFPSRIRDIDSFPKKIQEYELDPDHPEFTDPEYKKRRQHFISIAEKFRYGDKIPYVEYTPEEKETWKRVYKELTSLFPTHACKEFNHVFPLLEQNCGYSEDNVPQLEDVSNFLKDCTGFTLRPVAGFLSFRDLMGGLAFRVFHCVQYIRHPTMPTFSPEPDLCHELLGHAPLFADPAFADFAQSIGLASLGATDEFLEKLAKCFWYTLEFGLCKENDVIKAYGGALLSSSGELKYALENPKLHRNFDPHKAGFEDYPITKYQSFYYISESFQEAKEQILKYTSAVSPRPFGIRYNAYTQTLEILDTKPQIQRLIGSIVTEINILGNSLKKLGTT